MNSSRGLARLQRLESCRLDTVSAVASGSAFRSRNPLFVSGAGIDPPDELFQSYFSPSQLSELRHRRPSTRRHRTTQRARSRTHGVFKSILPLRPLRRFLRPFLGTDDPQPPSVWLLALHNCRYPSGTPFSRAVCLSVQEASSPRRKMDHSTHWQVCGLAQSHDGGIQETVGLWSSQCDQCLQCVRIVLRRVFKARVNPELTFWARFIVMAASNEFSRKILNSPTYAEPCLVNSAKQIILPENWCVI